MSEALFLRDKELYVPTPECCSPWSPQHLHGGPVVGLMAHAVEQASDSGHLNLTRLTVDLLRPAPNSPLAISTRLVRGGKRLQIMEASLLAGDTEVARASALFLENNPVSVPEYGRFPEPEFDPPSGPVEENISEAAGWQNQYSPEGLHSTAKAVVIDGVNGKGHGIAWMKLPMPLVQGVQMSPSVMAATLCDFGNGVGQLNLDSETGCINADVTLYLHRSPVGEWLGLDARSRMQNTGVGLVETTLFDSQGPVGKILQAIISMKMPGSGG
ncbi:MULTISPECIES: thioesterase family protein [unclassified Marinobacter]|uniref:thioesterase family protein n=1 Tax=unclassified Marinobacter TaxID=83889 RepID=UPI0026E2335C|nr:MULTISPECIES: thioesterase family protein [unclassified Marinobacter]MDO6442241.1 thioesterase family protein [Marinobacter sp. 2_MG-2023]MDO6824989.1 thioesterase family protein [Marinobacter sp. 1_MG-2023]